MLEPFRPVRDQYGPSPVCGKVTIAQGDKPMTWGQALTGLIVLIIAGPGIAYVIGRLRSGAPWATSRRTIVRGQSSSRDPSDDVW